MEVAAGAVLRRELPSHPAAAAVLRRGPRAVGWISGVSVRQQRSRGGCFADDGHLRYYGSPVRCGGRKEEKMMAKRREKLVEGLVGLQAMGGLDLAAMAGGEVEGGKMIMDEMADVLLARLDLLRAEEKEMKKRRKEEKAAMKAAAKQMKAPCDESSDSEDDDDDEQMKMTMKMKRKSEEKAKKMKASCEKTKDCGESEDSSSSSSSSESSDSDCEEELVDMKALRSSVPADSPPTTGEAEPVEKPEGRGATPTAAISLTRCSAAAAAAAFGSPSVSACCSKDVDSPAAMDRIEVCMGGKCKRSGAMELMQEFQRRVGVEGAVVGCKCLGKCKEGPNVRVRSSTSARGAAAAAAAAAGAAAAAAEESMAARAVTTPLCVGVGIQDVGAIVANFFAENEELGLAAA